MLKQETRNKIETHIQNIIREITDNSISSLSENIDNKTVLHDTVQKTVNLINLESKKLILDIYEALKQQTFQDRRFQSIDFKVRFYKANIYNTLVQQFSFKAPDNIKEIKEGTKINKNIASGTVGGAAVLLGVTIGKTGLLVPLAVALTLAGVTYTYLNSLEKKQKSEAVSAINEYLDNVKKAFLQWINEIEKFYDAEIEKIMGEL